MVNTAYLDPIPREDLDFQGTVTIESHTNLGGTVDSSISESMKRMSIRSAATAPILPPLRLTRKVPFKTGGMGNGAEQFYIHQTSDGRPVPLLVIEYKPPPKPSLVEIIMGLMSEINTRHNRQGST